MNINSILSAHSSLCETPSGGTCPRWKGQDFTGDQPFPCFLLFQGIICPCWPLTLFEGRSKSPWSVAQPHPQYPIYFANFCHGTKEGSLWNNHVRLRQICSHKPQIKNTDKFSDFTLWWSKTSFVLFHFIHLHRCLIPSSSPRNFFWRTANADIIVSSFTTFWNVKCHLHESKIIDACVKAQMMSLSEPTKKQFPNGFSWGQKTCTKESDFLSFPGWASLPSRGGRNVSSSQDLCLHESARNQR